MGNNQMRRLFAFIVTRGMSDDTVVAVLAHSRSDALKIYNNRMGTSLVEKDVEWEDPLDADMVYWYRSFD
jgi:hypothetical protein